MNPALYFYPVYVLGRGDTIKSFRGTCFPIFPSGTLLTCRHVVDIQLDRQAERLVVHDQLTGRFIDLPDPVLSPSIDIDLALLPNVIPGKAEFFPMLFPQLIHIGEEVYSFGYFLPGGGKQLASRGYFSGRIINIEADAARGGQPVLTLPYPIVEGLSGSPVLTYHNGVKLLGVAFGSQSQRILAAEVLEVQEGQSTFRETVHRVVEFGLAYQVAALISFMSSCGIDRVYLSDQRHPEIGLG